MLTETFDGKSDLTLRKMLTALEADMDRSMDDGSSCATYNSISKKYDLVYRALRARDYNRKYVK